LLQRIPPPISIPFLEVCEHLELPPVATYAAMCLWNFKPVFPDEPVDSLDNLATLHTFTGSMDESWFYLVSVAIEARGGPMIALMLDAMRAAREDDALAVTAALQIFAERLDDIGSMLNRMYERCDPHIFFHRIRPFIAGSRNMGEAGLPNGVLFEDGSGKAQWRQCGGGSNAQSSLIQFFDIVLGITHRPTGVGPSSSEPSTTAGESEATAPPPQHNFVLEMQDYMPGPHRRFLHDVTSAANIRSYVESHRDNRALTLAFDACLAMLRALRDKHIQLVSRYIIVKSREARSPSGVAAGDGHRSAPSQTLPLNLATASKGGKAARGTGGTALIPFLKQARDETGEPAIDQWARRLLGDTPGVQLVNRARAVAEQEALKVQKAVELGKVGEHADGDRYIVGMAGTWGVDDQEGGICHW
jgi:indoleamine 2,3-dioxygenase